MKLRISAAGVNFEMVLKQTPTQKIRAGDTISVSRA
jgi:hypothetical protein